jgi:organic hydroperoxide reductase OsmC/OhrA
MTVSIAMSFGAVSGTAAGLGRSGAHSLVADRPEGRAGGQGLGFNGGQLLAGALGGCFWNDLHYAADAAGVPVVVKAVDAEVDLAGTPLRVVRARIRAALEGADEAARTAVFAAACADSTIANSVMPAFPVRFERKDDER